MFAQDSQTPSRLGAQTDSIRHTLQDVSMVALRMYTYSRKEYVHVSTSKLLAQKLPTEFRELSIFP